MEVDEVICVIHKVKMCDVLVVGEEVGEEHALLSSDVPCWTTDVAVLMMLDLSSVFKVDRWREAVYEPAFDYVFLPVWK